MEMEDFLGRLEDGQFDQAMKAIEKRTTQLAWEKLPDRIVLLRHGQSEGNVDHLLYTSKGDSRLELTKKGIRQAREAGQRLQAITPPDANIIVCTSPFERTTQTLLAVYSGGFGGPNQELVQRVHVDPQIREQEFGNFQDPGLTQKVRVEEVRVGRFYYRRPNAESSADVFDRVTQFWDKLFGDFTGNGMLTRDEVKYDLCLVVTHGLTIRLMLMCLFEWSVETFGTVWNLGNCEHVTLQKNLETCKYEFCIAESYPPRTPWATRQAWIILATVPKPEELVVRLAKLEEARGKLLEVKNVADAEIAKLDKIIDDMENQILRERSEQFTVINYLEISQPRTMQISEVMCRLVRGHDHQGTSPEELAEQVLDAETRDMMEQNIEFIDWWGDQLSYQGKMLRTNRISYAHHRVKSGALSPLSPRNSTTSIPRSRTPMTPRRTGGPAAADAAAACARAKLPPPLPLPPNLTVADLPQRLRPTRRFQAAGNTVVKQAPASPGGPSLAEETDPACDRVDPPAAVDVTSEICEEVEGSQRAPRDESPAKPAAEDPEVERSSVRWLSPDLPADEWKEMPVTELKELATGILSDITTLGAECDRLFSEKCREVSGASYMDIEKLHQLTQVLIDRFAVRCPDTLERLRHVYAAVTVERDETGLSQLEFRGYVAAVLTQVLQDLEARIGQATGCTTKFG
ncbi:unnamed protein product [Durusdinium trenchii]|uniref:Uncharacterized protein n=1 Tax=Durusdinium trenchii TaxID=1381693 RepID=A0ABP0J516_9DINO